MGKAMIEMKKRETKSQIYVTFSKRRKGLFKKAAELSVLTDAKVAILTAGPGGKARVYSFGYPSADHVIRRYLNNSTSQTLLHEEKQQEEEDEEEGCWWDQDIGVFKSMDELVAYADALEKLKVNAMARLH
ncbi:hypothetical protein L1049_002856 [Liquidambar formosana]|uniref:MADS-box domain-containing protein n=1 Tax=Liquidambar formosana TaxID=63359 RepID=A0AAP0NGV6_LIQFO